MRMKKFLLPLVTVILALTATAQNTRELYFIQPVSGDPDPATDQQIPASAIPGIYSGEVNIKSGPTYFGFYTKEGETITKYSYQGPVSVSFGTDSSVWPNGYATVANPNQLKEMTPDTKTIMSWYITKNPVGCEGRYTVTVNMNNLTFSLKAIFEEYELPTTLYLMGMSHTNSVTIRQQMTPSADNPYLFETTVNVPYVEGEDINDPTSDNYMAPAFRFYFNTEGVVKADPIRNYGPVEVGEMLPIDASKTLRQQWRQGLASGLDPLPGNTTFRFNVETCELEVIYNDNLVMLTFEGEENISEPLSLITVYSPLIRKDIYLYAETMPFGFTDSGEYDLSVPAGYRFEVACDEGPAEGVYLLETPDSDVPAHADALFDKVRLGLFEGADGLSFTVRMSKGEPQGGNPGSNIPDDSGVDAISADDASVLYYNLQGQRIARPDRDVYIRVANGIATKVLR